MHHRGNMPGAPPPPLLRNRGPGGGSGSRPSGRSRSRSRSPPRGGGRFGGGRSERDSRDIRERDRDRDRDRKRSRSRSISPYGGGSSSRALRDRERDRDRKPSSTAAPSASKSSSTTSAAALDSLPAISIIHSESHNSIIRRILNPEDVKIPRRINEGSKPIFDREELREAMLRRMRNNDNEENPPQPNVYIQEPSVTQQRVVAIIREPVGGSSIDMYMSPKDSAYHSAKGSSGGAGPSQQRMSPELRTSTYNRRSPSPRTIRQGSSGSRRPSSRSPPPPPQLSSRGRSIDRDRDRLIVERERALDREREQLMREREQHGGRERLPHQERERDLRDHHLRNDRERDNRPRFPAGAQMEIRQRVRSRSPIMRVPREDMRLRRRSRSHSVTPPPMPDEFRRQLILERQKQIDLRNSLSRQPGKIGDDRMKRQGPPGPRGGGRGGRGGFQSRTIRGRQDERRAWVHDMFDGGDEPKKG